MKTPIDIAIFDSGVGGLTVLSEITQLIPEANLLFISDNAAYPYGTKSDEQLLDRVDQVMTRLTQQFHPKLIVIACNSASTICLTHLREKFNTPFVGVVPAIKPAAKYTRTKTIGLLATPATIKRSYTKQLIHDFAKDCNVIHVGSSELVDMAEQKIQGKQIDMMRLKQILTPFNSGSKTDVVILGCTHFPVLADDIHRVLGNQTLLLDSGKAIARQCKRIIEKHGIQLSSNQQHQFVFTKQFKMTDNWKTVMQKYDLSDYTTIKI